MPTINKQFVLPSGDSVEILETSAMTNGERVRARFFLKPNVIRVGPHIHVRQDESYEVISGKLTCFLKDKKHVVEAGSTIVLPRGIPHQHYNEGPDDAVAIETMTPGLDFDYALENIFGLASEQKGLSGLGLKLYGLVRIRRMKSTILLADVPQWFQYALAWVVTPVAELFGYRAIYRRFSGEGA
jgi:mannose-6-phosphate isomerase-like protein (cupin superfamily)